MATADLTFLGNLSAHMTMCADCWKPWVDSSAGERAVDYLVWALKKTSLKDIMRAVETEIAAVDSADKGGYQQVLMPGDDLWEEYRV
jgi:hypothetical protein